MSKSNGNRAYDIVVPARFVSNPPDLEKLSSDRLMAQRIELPEPAANAEGRETT
ncbi:hypothetical protein [Klebsiella pneumoniae]|uniref:hypothetical protein n=1 Tax=Klebsiella pneumoniae TaxID=573 RepID=UPI001D0DB3C2|nr:hypothetical protein [Klebsiella pneumoniae]